MQNAHRLGQGRPAGPGSAGGFRLGQRLQRSRMYGWDGNPVRRRSDRLEGYLLAGLVAVFLIAAPVVAATAERWVSAIGVRQQLAEQAWRRGPRTADGGPAQVRASPSGFVARSPEQRAELRSWVEAAEVITPFGLAVFLIFVGREGQFLLGRHRQAQWEKP